MRPDTSLSTKTMKPKAIGDLLRPQVKQLLGARALGEARLIENWASIINDEAAIGCTPSHIDFKAASNRGGKASRTNGRLVIFAPSGLATELNFKKAQLIEKINRHFGYGLIGDIKLIQQTAVQPQNASKDHAETQRNIGANLEKLANHMQAFEHIDDPDLRRSLARLSLSLTKSDTNKSEINKPEIKE
ncbi:MAG: DciA family protein [Alphaproteobacteria bacterium]